MLATAIVILELVPRIQSVNLSISIEHGRLSSKLSLPKFLDCDPICSSS